MDKNTLNEILIEALDEYFPKGEDQSSAMLLLMVYHNTLLHALAQEAEGKTAPPIPRNIKQG